MKRFFVILLCVLLTFSGCTQNNTHLNTTNNNKLNIVATIFPQYDFVRQIAGDNVNLTMLIPPGSESHTYDPSPGDIKKIQNCDLIIYTGGNGDEWLHTILESMETPVTTIELLNVITPLEEKHIDGMQISDEYINFSRDVNGHKHNHEYDEHAWTSPVNADIICKEICKKLCELDTKNSHIYINNYTNYSKQLNELDKEVKTIVNNSEKDTIIFADRFPIRYFTEEYGINYYAAFPGCASEVEPSPKTLIFLINKIRKNNINAVFYREFSNRKVAKIISEETGVKMLLFHSCHSVSSEEFNNGTTYLSLMKNNIANLKEALE